MGMGGKKKLTKASTALARSTVGSASRGRTHASGASFHVAPTRSELPIGYAEMLGEIKLRIQQERLRIVLTANAAMVMLYWDIGRMILDRQERAGWGVKVIDPVAVLRLLAEDPNLSVPQVAARLKKSELTIHRAIRTLRESGRLTRVGPDKGGCWRVLQ
jgi:biotin operon repressor